MHRHCFASLGALLAVAIASAPACAGSDALTTGAPATEAGVSSALQARAAHATGVDQHSRTHRFDPLPDGGRIELQSDADDPAVVDQIRRHLREIAEAFASDDVSLPAFAHMREAPGMAFLAARKDRIESVYRDLPRGAELRLVTNDPEAIRAIHQFMDHGTRDHPPHSAGAGHGMHGGHARGGDTP